MALQCNGGQCVRCWGLAMLSRLSAGGDGGGRWWQAVQGLRPQLCLHVMTQARASKHGRAAAVPLACGWAGLLRCLSTVLALHPAGLHDLWVAQLCLRGCSYS
uniref:Uncharacterized protein n=1 Tax=Chlamydomonas leiostraca TaxID=1034604 RepID=A0A7S0RG10_9CHLO|mmetsp:Transcript_21174/g.53833  ORF Transcript_21174/g.53833 Transcript_21174/m.53833 type:complete len:103 (+) Transcript_21174:750-1058(+)